MTEIYDFMRLLFARIGRTFSPISGTEVKRHQVSDVTDFILQQPQDTRILLHIPLQQKYTDRTL
jgi:excinuclease ABC subunit A